MSYFDMSAQLPQLKNELEWLKEPDKNALQYSLKNLDRAYQNFFREIKKGNKNQGFPKFKSKKNNFKSYRTICLYFKNKIPSIEIKNNKIKLPKLKSVKYVKSREIEGKIISVIINQVPSGKYFIDICFETDNIEKEKLNSKIGIDLGIKNYAILSNGEKIDNPKCYKKYEQKLKKEQRKLSNKQKGSKNRNKQRIKFAKIHEKILNCRNDFLHKLSTKLINENQVICLENLKVIEMLKNRKSKLMNKNMSDVSWYEFKRQLLYKGDWYGRNIILIDQYFPSSQLCSNCGFKNEKLKELDVREWICPNCNSIHDRDINAAINIKNEGLRLLNNMNYI